MIRILTGDCLEVLGTLPDASVHMCCTSPPYYGLRSYGIGAENGEIGLEDTPDAYVAQLVAVFREVRRTLRPDGTCWINLGDSRANKQLLGIPWRVAFALQADGWWLRDDIIWHKPNPMPESVRDRCTKAHEHVFLLSKQARYFYDAEAISEASLGIERPNFDGRRGSLPKSASRGVAGGDAADRMGDDGTRNKRSVWTIATQPFSAAHFATFPPELAETCIKAGTSEKGCCPHCGLQWARQVERTPMVIDRSERTHDKGQTRSSGTMLEPPSSKTTGWAPTCSCPEHKPVPATVLDPFGGAGTTGLVADRLQRSAILIELNPGYAEMSRKRMTDDAGLFAEVA